MRRIAPVYYEDGSREWLAPAFQEFTRDGTVWCVMVVAPGEPVTVPAPINNWGPGLGQVLAWVRFTVTTRSRRRWSVLVFDRARKDIAGRFQATAATTVADKPTALSIACAACLDPTRELARSRAMVGPLPGWGTLADLMTE